MSFRPCFSSIATVIRGLQTRPADRPPDHPSGVSYWDVPADPRQPLWFAGLFAIPIVWLSLSSLFLSKLEFFGSDFVRHNGIEVVAPICSSLCLFPLIAYLNIVHRDSLATLFGPDRNFHVRPLVHSFLTWTGLQAAMLIVVAPAALSANFRAFVLSTPLFLVQAASEELFFRGYMSRALTRTAPGPKRSRHTTALIVATIFSVSHLPDLGAAITTFLLSLALTAMTWREGRIETAIGLHAAWNATATLFAGHVADMDGAEAIAWMPFLVSNCLLPAAWLSAFWLIRYGRLNPLRTTSKPVA